MRVTPINTQYCNNQSFGQVNMFTTMGMPSVAERVIAKNYKEIEEAVKDVVLKDLSVQGSGYGRYFDVKIAPLKASSPETEDRFFSANIRTNFNEDTQEETVKQALFNNIKRAREACLNTNK